MSPDELRDWFADYLDAGNRHDLGTLRGLIDPAVRRAHLPGGADAWIADLEVLFAAFPDFQWKRIALIVEGDRLAAHVRAGAPIAAPFEGSPRPAAASTSPSSRCTGSPEDGSSNSPAPPMTTRSWLR